MNSFVLLIAFLTIFNCINCQAFSSIERYCQINDTRCLAVDEPLTFVDPPDAILDRLDNATYYDRNRPPGASKGTKETILGSIWQTYHLQKIPELTKVWTAVYFESISSFQAATMDYNADILFVLSWYDYRLTHNSSTPILISDLNIQQKMWFPDVYFMNSKKAKFHTVPSPNFLMLVYSDGLVFHNARFDVTLSCMMDLAKFPMDEQRCPFYVQSYAYVKQMVRLIWFHKANTSFPIAYNEKIVLNDMYITNQSTSECIEYEYPLFRGKGIWSCLVAHITMKRTLLFYILQTYIPSAMLVCISWLSFWLDVKATPARISLSITTLLTLVSVSNGARHGLPQVSYIKAIDVWLTVATAFVFSTLLEFTFICHVTTKRNFNCKMHMGLIALSPHAKRLLKKGGNGLQDCKTCAGIYYRRGLFVDAVARIVFPSGFLLFTLVYWIAYMTWKGNAIN